MKRNSLYLIVIVMAIFISNALLASCRRDSGHLVDTADLQKYQTGYVGDAPKVVNIVSQQEYPNGYAYNHIEIQSETEPYGLKIYLKVDPPAAEIGDGFKVNADTTFDLIGNLGVLDYIDCDSNENLASYERPED